MWRIGTGFDVHALVEGRPLILGGLEIPHDKGLQGHSDADVLLHAVMDALLGALALGDIGQHFPDSDERYRGADSRQLLRHVHEKVRELGFAVGNLDCTVQAQRPKLRPYIEEMRKNLSEDLQVSVGQFQSRQPPPSAWGLWGVKKVLRQKL